VVRFAAALLLVLAATGKAVAHVRGVTEPMFGLVGPGWVLAVVWVECLLAAWLVLGWRPGLCRRVAGAAFCVFAFVGTVQALRGQERCGCFGVVRVPLGLMVPLDLAVAVGLVSARPAAPGLACARPVLARMLGWVAVGLCALPGMAAGSAWARQFASGKGSVILTPEGISGRPAAFLAHVEGGALLARGRWRVLAYRDDCRDCARALPAFARAALRGQGDPAYAVLLLPGSAWPAAAGGRLRVLRADPSLTWYVVTPLVMELRDGVVERAERDLEGAVAGEEAAARPAWEFVSFGFLTFSPHGGAPEWTVHQAAAQRKEHGHVGSAGFEDVSAAAGCGTGFGRRGCCAGAAVHGLHGVGPWRGESDLRLHEVVGVPARPAGAV